MLDVIKKDVIKNGNEIPDETYSIGLYEGSSPFELQPAKVNNPIISRKNFLPGIVNFVADPFAIFEKNCWYLFYESMEMGTRRGKIRVSTSTDMISWSEGIDILEEPFHLSYPHVFKNGSDYFMIPESYESAEVRLYKAIDFPHKWEFEKVLLEKPCVDTTVFQWDNMWWMFTCDSPQIHDRLRLYYSSSLDGEWTEHPQSPIRENDNQSSRPAGKLLQYNEKLFRFAQNCIPFYGHSIRAFEIETLSILDFKEKEISGNPILAGGSEEWNRVSMHHIDLHKMEENNWVAFVDGRFN